MDFVVFDLEWNQAGYGRPMIREPLPLEGEIIQIGAVKLSEALETLGEFKIYIKPRVYRKMNRKVQQITHISNEDLASGADFKDAIEQFSAFCGEDFRFVTWGSDDMRVLRQNLAFKHCDAAWVPEINYDLQLVYDKAQGNKNESSLGAVVEHYGIALDRPQHDALNDAYYTACIMDKIGLEAVNQLYSAPVMPKRSGEIKRTEFPVVGSRRKAVTKLKTVSCPLCDAALDCTPWVEQGNGRYISCCECAEHGGLFMRLRFKRIGEETLCGIMTVFEMSDEYRELYNQRSEQAAQKPAKNRRPRRKKKVSAQTAPTQPTGESEGKTE